MPNLPSQMGAFSREVAGPGQQSGVDSDRQKLAAAIGQAIVANGQTMAKIMQGLTMLIEHMNAPKEVIRDAQGRAVGIRRIGG